MGTDCKPIESLKCEDECAPKEQSCGSYGMGGGWIGSLILWFIIIAVIVWFILWALKPVSVQRLNPDGTPTGEPDAGKVLIGSIIIALVIVIIIWLIRACAKM